MMSSEFNGAELEPPGDVIGEHGLNICREGVRRLRLIGIEFPVETGVEHVELGADIYHNGIYLTGGGSQLVHLADMIADATGLIVNVSEEPVATVIRGLNCIMREKRFASLARSIEETK